MKGKFSHQLVIDLIHNEDGTVSVCEIQDIGISALTGASIYQGTDFYQDIKATAGKQGLNEYHLLLAMVTTNKALTHCLMPEIFGDQTVVTFAGREAKAVADSILAKMGEQDLYVIKKPRSASQGEGVFIVPRGNLEDLITLLKVYGDIANDFQYFLKTRELPIDTSTIYYHRPSRELDAIDRDALIRLLHDKDPNLASIYTRLEAEGVLELSQIDKWCQHGTRKYLPSDSMSSGRGSITEPPETILVQKFAPGRKMSLAQAYAECGMMVELAGGGEEVTRKPTTRMVIEFETEGGRLIDVKPVLAYHKFSGNHEGGETSREGLISRASNPAPVHPDVMNEMFEQLREGLRTSIRRIVETYDKDLISQLLRSNDRDVIIVGCSLIEHCMINNHTDMQGFSEPLAKAASSGALEDRIKPMTLYGNHYLRNYSIDLAIVQSAIEITATNCDYRTARACANVIALYESDRHLNDISIQYRVNAVVNILRQIESTGLPETTSRADLKSINGDGSLDLPVGHYDLEHYYLDSLVAISQIIQNSPDVISAMDDIQLNQLLSNGLRFVHRSEGVGTYCTTSGIVSALEQIVSNNRISFDQLNTSYPQLIDSMKSHLLNNEGEYPVLRQLTGVAFDISHVQIDKFRDYHEPPITILQEIDLSGIELPPLRFRPESIEALKSHHTQSAELQ